MKGKTAAGAILILFSACAAGAGVYAVQSLKKARFDPQTLCPLTGATSLTLIILDKTDPLTAQEQDLTREAAAAERDALPRHGRLSLNVLSRPGALGAPALSKAADLCNPGSEANPFLENPKKVAALYAGAFLEPLDQALKTIASTGPAPSSPIAASIEAALMKPPLPGGAAIKLLLISDLMEHTATASAYSGTLTEAALEKQMPQSAAALKGAEVKILLLPRPQFKKQQEAAVTIWRRVLKKISGREAQFVRL